MVSTFRLRHITPPPFHPSFSNVINFFLKIKVSVRNSEHVFQGLSFFNVLRVITSPKCFSY